jgi:glycerol-3-phosphate responsive antiterminator
VKAVEDLVRLLPGVASGVVENLHPVLHVAEAVVHGGVVRTGGGRGGENEGSDHGGC